MKKLILFTILIALWGMQCSAENNSGADPMMLTSEHHTDSSIICISANNNDEIAVGFDDNHVNVYDSKGTFEYGYSLDINGTYFLRYDENANLMIFVVRGSTKYTFDRGGKLLQTEKIKNSVESDRFFNINGGLHKVKSNRFTYEVVESFGRQELVRIDRNGATLKIYEMGNFYYIKVLKRLLLCLFVIVAITLVYERFRLERDKIKSMR